MSSLTENKDSCYDNSHELFLRFSNHDQALENFLRKHLPNILKKVDQQYDSQELNVLSIGSGNGNNDMTILKLLIQSVKQDGRIAQSVTNRAIEPSSKSLLKYRDLLESTKREGFLEKVQFELENKTFDEYSDESSHPKNQYDFIHAVHCFHFNRDVKQSLQHCYNNELRDKGAILFVMGKEDVSIFLKIAARLNNDRKHFILSQGLIEIIIQCGYKHSVFSFEYSIDITNILENVTEDREASALLDFLTFKKDFVKNFDKNVVDDIFDLLRNESCQDCTGRVILNTLGQLVVVYKQ